MPQQLARGFGWLSVAALAFFSSIRPEQIESWPVICPFRRFLGFECYGCGMTRAITSALHGEWSEALTLNALVMVVLPLMLLAAAWALVDGARLLMRAAAALSPGTRADLWRAAFWSWIVIAGVGGVLVATPFALPHQMLEGWVGICPAKAAGSSCSLCGMTTAFYLISEGRWHDATASHAASIPLYAGLAGNSVAGFVESARNLFRISRKRSNGEP